MDTIEFNDIEKQLAKEIFDGTKCIMETWYIKKTTINKSFDSIPERIKVGFYLIARYILERF